MPQDDLQTDEQLQKMKEDLQAAVEQSRTEVRHLKELLKEKTEEINQVEAERQEWTAAYIHVVNRLTVTQAALEENTRKNQDLEKKHQEVCEKRRLQQGEMEEKRELFRSKMTDEINKLKEKLSLRMEAHEQELSAREAAFQGRLQEIRYCDEAGDKDWAEEERGMEDRILRKDEGIKELKVRLFFSDQCLKNNCLKMKSKPNVFFVFFTAQNKKG